MKSLKILSIVLSLCILTFTFTSCTKKDDFESLSLANSQIGSEYNLVNDTINNKVIPLYLPDNNSDNLVRVVEQIVFFEDKGIVSATVQKLLSSESTENYEAPFKSKADVGWVIVSRKLASINILGDFSELTEKEIFAGIVSIVNTVCELNNVNYVEILFNGIPYSSRGVLSNPMYIMNEPLHLLYLNHMDIINNTTSSSIYRNEVILYNLDLSASFLISEISNLEINNDNVAEYLFNQLKNEPNYGSGMTSCIPRNVIMPTQPTITIEDDKKIININLEAPKYETMDNKTRHMMCGGITLTLLSYFHDVSYVRILINSQPAFETPLIDRYMFLENIGQLVPFYLPNKNKQYLVKIQNAMSQKRCYNPRECVIEMINMQSTYHKNITSIFPANINEEDILNVVVNNSSCVVNMSQNLTSKLENLSDTQKKMFIYSIVNTLTELENIDTIQFIVEGKIYEKIGNSMYIETPLMSNPGIVYNKN